ncbi:DUF5675 family protein [Emticicia sp. SJ17W-69]|uniref:DUF5675 family protein n=1 Tax=Emticicia sp. SJ17W-69 TaxID=3421657 RepID=UPI003EB7181C
MELILKRTYFQDGTNGEIFLDQEKICCTIELPWRNNEKRISCIPEGRYQLKKRYSQKLKFHILLNDVTERDLILIHPANEALKELKGCIAPVLQHTSAGKGINSRFANERLKKLVFDAFAKGEEVFLKIVPLAPLSHQ